MKSYKPLEMAAIFFSSEPFLKQGISFVYVMVDFIRMGLLELCGSRVERQLQNVKFLPIGVIRTHDLMLTKRARYHWTTKTDVNGVDNSSPGFYLCYF